MTPITRVFCRRRPLIVVGRPNMVKIVKILDFQMNAVAAGWQAPDA